MAKMEDATNYSISLPPRSVLPAHHWPGAFLQLYFLLSPAMLLFKLLVTRRLAAVGLEVRHKLVHYISC